MRHCSMADITRCSQVAQGPLEALAEGLAVAAEDVGDFEARALHRAAAGPRPAAGGRGSRSGGLVAAQTLVAATCR